MYHFVAFTGRQIPVHKETRREIYFMRILFFFLLKLGLWNLQKTVNIRDKQLTVSNKKYDLHRVVKTNKVS